MSPSTVSLRPESAGDLEFACRLYASSREYEMIRVPWTDDQKAEFLRSQFQFQYIHYHKYYPDAAYGIVMLDGCDIGRVYVDRTPTEIRLMEVTLLPEFRNRGIGGGLVRALMQEASTAGKKVSLHVEVDNPARRLYDRLGFQPVQEEGIYILMEWSGRVAEAAS